MAFIGTPHYGSPAIAGYLKNHLWGFESLALLGRYPDRSAFRSMRGVLNLMPAPEDVYPGAAPNAHPCANFDLYDADAWRLDLNPGERAALQAALDDTARLHRDLHPGTNGWTRNSGNAWRSSPGWVIGRCSGSPTVRVRVTLAAHGPDHPARTGERESRGRRPRATRISDARWRRGPVR